MATSTPAFPQTVKMYCAQTTTAVNGGTELYNSVNTGLISLISAVGANGAMLVGLVATPVLEAGVSTAYRANVLVSPTGSAGPFYVLETATIPVNAAATTYIPTTMFSPSHANPVFLPAGSSVYVASTAATGTVYIATTMEL